ncbi:11751_t:CDS:2 [Cetraspora pellucida]|uniref:11751_t:CDS:1 n=1 Tax=Cetraspora pellucida TaxID=1433469 RepID=A0ACA9KS43_9GLOM|nr:11751_t:CDS:2 [Cetraspora pellucida]
MDSIKLEQDIDRSLSLLNIQYDNNINTILNTIKQEVKECLKLLDIPFQTENLLRSLKKLYSQIQINDPKSFNTNSESKSMEALIKACYNNGWVIETKPEFISKKYEPKPETSFKCLKLLIPQTPKFNSELNYINNLTEAYYNCGIIKKNNPKYRDRKYKNKPNISFIRKLNSCYYYLIDETHEEKSVKTKIDDLITVSDPNQEKLWKCLKSLMPQTSYFNPEFDYIDNLMEACYNHDTIKQNDPKYKNKKYNPKLDIKFNELTDEIKKLKKENEELKKNNSETAKNKINKLNKKIAALKKTNDTLNSQLNTTLNLLEINFNDKILIERKMELVVEGVEAYSRIKKPE